MLTLNLPAFGQGAQPTDKKAGSGQKEYRLIASNDAFTLGAELDRAAKEGFRFAFLSRIFSDSRVGVLLTRQVGEHPSAATFEYRVLGASRIQTIREQLDTAAAQGWTLRGMASNASIMMFTISETILVMERRSGQRQPEDEYRFLTANREATMQQEIEAAVSAGFHPAEMSVTRDNNAMSVVFGMPVLRFDVIMRRRVASPSAAPATRKYRFISTLKPGTMEKEMNQLASQGFRLHLTALGWVALMSREDKSAPQDQVEYRLLATRRTGTLQKELAAAGKKGWCYLGMTGLGAVMERHKTGTSPPHDYHLLAAARKTTTQKELEAAIAAGNEVIDLISLGEFITILERPLSHQ